MIEFHSGIEVFCARCFLRRKIPARNNAYRSTIIADPCIPAMRPMDNETTDTNEVTRMRFNPIKLLEGLLCTAPALLLTLAACGGGGGGSTPATIIPVVAPTVAPTGVSATGGCTAININWSAVAGATGYNVYGVSGVTATKLTAVTTTSYTNTGLAPSTSYSYQVTATNSAGEGPASTAVSASTKSACTVMGGSIQGNALVLSQVVSTLAGAGPLLPGSADGTGTAAQFNTPGGVTTDGTNLYVADTSNHTIRKIVISTGAVTTLAGAAGTPGKADGIGSAARFHGPIGITISPDKFTLYVADTQNDTIRQIIISTGAVTTVAGIALSPGFANNTTGTSATFNVPAGITTDGTNLYVADTGNNAIRQIALSGSLPVTTVAGTGTAGYVDSTSGAPLFRAPQGITTDGTNLYVADTANNVIRQIVIVGATVSTVAGSGTPSFVNGTSTGATFNAPQGITMDGANLNLYVGDTKNNAVRQITISGATVTTVAGSGTAGFVNGTGTAAQFNLPNGITTDGTNLYTADAANQTIRKIQ